jgi:hypothetical protein
MDFGIGVYFGACDLAQRWRCLLKVQEKRSGRHNVVAFYKGWRVEWGVARRLMGS